MPCLDTLRLAHEGTLPHRVARIELPNYRSPRGHSSLFGVGVRIDLPPGTTKHVRRKSDLSEETHAANS